MMYKPRESIDTEYLLKKLLPHNNNEQNIERG